MNASKISELIQFACDKNGRPDIAAMIAVSWSNRMIVTMGKVHGGPLIGYKMTLSAKIFASISEEEQRDTVIHETCHVIDGHVNNRKMSHGEGWKVAMCRAGLEPRRIYEAEVNPLVKRFIYSCPNKCKDEYPLSTILHNRVSKGRTRICAKCHSCLSFTGKVEGA
jgi:predicted SprT family Zn-dependent metalloprotease